MIVTIKSAEKLSGDYGEYIKISGISNNKEITKELLKENATVEFVMVQKNNRWNIDDIKTIELPPVVSEAKKEGAVIVGVSDKIAPKDWQISNAVGAKGAIELVCADKIKLDEFGKWTRAISKLVMTHNGNN
jgi:hypothetical protein